MVPQSFTRGCLTVALTGHPLTSPQRLSVEGGCLTVWSVGWPDTDGWVSRSASRRDAPSRKGLLPRLDQATWDAALALEDYGTVQASYSCQKGRMVHVSSFKCSSQIPDILSTAPWNSYSFSFCEPFPSLPSSPWVSVCVPACRTHLSSSLFLVLVTV